MCLMICWLVLVFFECWELESRKLLELMLKYPNWCWLKVLEKDPNQNGNALAKKPRLSQVGNSLPQISITTSWPVVITMDREGVHGMSMVACEASHFVQVMSPTFTDHFTTSGLDRSSCRRSWKFVSFVVLCKLTIATAWRTKDRLLGRGIPSWIVKMDVVPGGAASSEGL